MQQETDLQKKRRNQQAKRSSTFIKNQRSLDFKRPVMDFFLFIGDNSESFVINGLPVKLIKLDRSIKKKHSSIDILIQELLMLVKKNEIGINKVLDSCPSLFKKDPKGRENLLFMPDRNQYKTNRLKLNLTQRDMDNVLSLGYDYERNQGVVSHMKELPIDKPSARAVLVKELAAQEFLIFLDKEGITTQALEFKDGLTVETLAKMNEHG